MFSKKYTKLLLALCLVCNNILAVGSNGGGANETAPKRIKAPAKTDSTTDESELPAPMLAPPEDLPLNEEILTVPLKDESDSLTQYLQKVYVHKIVKDLVDQARAIRNTQGSEFDRIIRNGERRYKETVVAVNRDNGDLEYKDYMRDWTNQKNNYTEHYIKIHAKDWIKAEFDNSEKEINKRINEWIKIEDEKAAGTSNLPMFSVKTINALFNKVANDNPGDLNRDGIIHTVIGMDIQDLFNEQFGHNTDGHFAINALCSQLNALEAIGEANRADVSSYIDDKTQGPQGAIATAAATMYRDCKITASTGEIDQTTNKFKVTNPGLHALMNIFGTDTTYTKGDYPVYKNGYLMPHRLNEQGQEKLSRLLKDNIDKLQMVLQWSPCEESQNNSLVACLAAPAYSRFTFRNLEDQTMVDKERGEKYTLTQADKEICETLVSAQYKALAKVAVIISELTKKPVYLNLTAVGQGVFKNPEDTIYKALKDALEIVKPYEKVIMCYHIFEANKKDNIVQGIKAQLNTSGKNDTVKELPQLHY